MRILVHTTSNLLCNIFLRFIINHNWNKQHTKTFLKRISIHVIQVLSLLFTNIIYHISNLPQFVKIQVLTACLMHVLVNIHIYERLGDLLTLSKWCYVISRQTEQAILVYFSHQNTYKFTLTQKLFTGEHLYYRSGLYCGSNWLSVCTWWSHIVRMILWTVHCGKFSQIHT